MSKNIKVSVCMITYGHEKFIEEAINGVLMQEVDFEIELIISNDSSPDKTDEIVKSIIKTHPRGSWIKYTKQDPNIGMMLNTQFVLDNSKGEYIAACEGDDYWTDSLKLQKQIDFLENNKEAMGCFHHASFVDQDRSIINEIYNPKVGEINSYNQEQCLKILKSSYATCSLVFRKNVLKNAPKILLSNLCDEILDIIITENGKLFFLNFNGASYRYHSGGVWSGTSTIKLNLIQYHRVLVLYSVPKLRKQYGDFLSDRIKTLSKSFLFSNSIKKSERINYFLKTMRFLDYKKSKTYDFIAAFCKNIIFNVKVEY